jgi:MqsR (Motility quorum-sensing regulator) toxin of toxin-antitoxin system
MHCGLPTCSLREIKQLFKARKWRITVTAQATALELEFDDGDIFDCIVNCLKETHFYKTMPALKRPGLMQDVYRVAYKDCRIYLKLQIVNDCAVVTSFKKE